MKSTHSSNVPRPSEGPHAADLRARLQAELVRRCDANAQYSLRAFALDLDIDHATLSQLLRGRRALTRTTIERLGKRLRLAQDEIDACVRHAEHERDGEPRLDDHARVHEIETLSQYAAAIVTQWEHLALLELTHVRGFQPDVGWIARVLGLETDAVTLALNRLMHLGLLEMQDERTWLDVSGPTVFRGGAGDPSAFGAAAARALLERVSALAPARSARNDLPQEHSATTLAVSTRRLPEAITRLHAAHAEIAALLEADSPRDEVYRLETRLFPLTRPPTAS